MAEDREDKAEVWDKVDRAEVWVKVDKAEAWGLAEALVVIKVERLA